jgi:hypothetical protein
MKYVDSTEDPIIQIVKMHENTTNSAMIQTARSLKRESQKETIQIKDSIAQKIKERWWGEIMHGQFPCNLDKKTGG